MSRTWMLILAVLSLITSGAMADYEIVDFESGNPFSAGTVVTDPADPTNQVLYVASGELATMNLAEPLTPGRWVSMRVYDRGAVEQTGETVDGFNFGVSGEYNCGAALVNRSFFPCTYGYCWTGEYNYTWPQSAIIRNFGIFDEPREVTSLAVIGSGTPAEPEIPGVGAWSTWTFSMSDDGMEVSNAEMNVSQCTYITESVPTEIYVYGGSPLGNLGKVWVDDVTTWQPAAPSTPGETTIFLCIDGDADKDEDVDLHDFVILKRNFGTGTTWEEGDFNQDGRVDLADFELLKQHFGESLRTDMIMGEWYFASWYDWDWDGDHDLFDCRWVLMHYGEWVCPPNDLNID